MMLFFKDVQQTHDTDGERAPHTNKQTDDVQVDEIQAFKLKMTKWVKASHVAVKTHEFWTMMRICHSAKKPLDHCLHALEAKPTYDDVRCGRTVLSKLVCGKGEEIFTEFENVLRDTERWDAEAAGLVNITPNMMYSALIALVLTGACEFDIRVLERLTSFPYQWMLMVQRPPDVCCPLRVKCVDFLLSCSPESVDISTAKLIKLWHTELTQCKTSGGKLCNNIYWTLCTFRCELECTVQEVEGHAFNYTSSFELLNDAACT